MIHCTDLPSRIMAFISQLLGMLMANFSQLSSSLDEQSWITQKLLDYDPKVIGLWKFMPLSRVHFTSNDWLMQGYKCLVFLLQTGTSLKGHPSSRSPSMVGCVFVAIATKFNYSICPIWLPSFPHRLLIPRVFSNRLLHVNPTNLHLCSPGCSACDSDRLISVLTIYIFLIIRKSRLQHCSVDFLTKCSYHRMEHPVTQTSSAAICLLVLLSLL